MGQDAMPVMTGPVMTGATRIERRERSWTIHAGSLRFGLSTVDYSAAMIAPPTYAFAPVPPRRAGMVTRVAGALLATIGAGTIVGIAVQAGTVSAHTPYVVSVPLPLPPVVERDDADSSPAVTLPRQRAPIAATIPVVPVPQPTTRPIERPVAMPSPAIPARNEPVALDPDRPLTSMAQAIAAASASGHLQQWSDAEGLDHGFVVAGPSEGGCRTLSVLIRHAGSDDRVERRQACGDRVETDSSPS